MAKGQELAQQNDAATELVKMRLAQDMLRNDDDSNADVMARIANELAAAETVDDVLEGGSTTEVDAVLDVPLTIRDFILRPSDLPGMFDVNAFAVIDAVREDTGEVIVISCGGHNVMVALCRIDQLKGFPVEHVAFREAGRALRLYRWNAGVIEQSVSG